LKLQRALSANNAEDATKAPHLSAAASSMQLSPAVSRCRCRALGPYWQLVQDAHLHRVYSGSRWAEAASAARGGHWASAGPFPQPAKPPKAADGTTSPLVSRSTQADGTTSPVGVARSTNASQRRTDRHEHLRLFVVSRAMRQAQLSFHNSSSHA
jgi:hypothetical protein